jgi:transposase
MTKRRWRAEDARAVLAALDDAGVTQAAFAARHGIHPLRLWRWRARLSGAERASAASPATALFPVEVRDDELGTAAPPRIEVALPDGVVVRLAPGFDADSLRRVLAVLAC